VREPPREARLVERRDLGPTLAIFRIEPDGGVPAFEPGQFITLGVPRESGRMLWRPYSIASPPEERRYFELFIRLSRVPAGAPHLTAMLWSMQPGERLAWRGPKGRFTIADRHPDGSPDERCLLLIAGGTGLAPFVSGVLHRRRSRNARPIVLCHGARSVAELGFRDVLLELERASRAEGGERWSFRYLPTISRPLERENVGWSGHVGRVESLLAKPREGARSAVEEAIGAALDPRTTCAYVCGFDGTVAAALSVLEPMGFRTRANQRPDGSWDVDSESFG